MISKKTNALGISKDFKNNFETTQDKIFAWYVDDAGAVTLTEKEETIRQRWSAAYALLCKYMSPQQAIPLLKQEFSISEAQAYRDIKNAISLFGNVGKSEKEGYRHIIYEYAMRVFQLSAKKKDLAQMNKAISNMISLKGLDREDPDLPDFSKLQPHQYNIDIPDEALLLLQQIISKGVVDVTTLMRKDAAVDAEIIEDSTDETNT